MRAFDPAVLAQLQADRNSIRYFAALEFDAGTEYLWTGLGQIDALGQTWEGVGGLATIEGLEEGIDLSPFALSLGLSRLDAQVGSLAINETFQHRPITLYLGAMLDGALVADPGVVFQGEMLDVETTVGAEGGEVIVLTCENELARLDRSSNVRYTDIQLQSEYPGDLAFEFLSQLKDYRPTWRGKNKTSLGGTRGSGTGIGPSGGGGSGGSGRSGRIGR